MPARDEVEGGRPFAPRFYCGGDDPTCPVHGLDRDDDTPFCRICGQPGGDNCNNCSVPERKTPPDPALAPVHPAYRALHCVTPGCPNPPAPGYGICYDCWRIKDQEEHPADG